jgi:hypothetical protein
MILKIKFLKEKKERKLLKVAIHDSIKKKPKKKIKDMKLYNERRWLIGEINRLLRTHGGKIKRNWEYTKKHLPIL